MYIHITGKKIENTASKYLNKALWLGLYFTNSLSRMNERTYAIALLAHRCCYVATYGYRRSNGGISTQALYWDHFPFFGKGLQKILDWKGKLLTVYDLLVSTSP